jgi:hypothetical protein
MTTESKKRPLVLWVMLCTLIFELISAVPYGFMLAVDPTGELAGIQAEVLKDTIFDNFRIPGLILLIVLGFGSFFIAAVLFRLPDWNWIRHLNPSRNQHWTWIATICFGLVIMAWITVQVIMIGFDSWLQPLHFSIGLLIVILSFMPSMRKYLTSR